VFSDADVQAALADFVLVKVDPRSRSYDSSAARYKKTRFVPEVVFVDPRGNVISRLNTSLGAADAAHEIRNVAARAKVINGR